MAYSMNANELLINREIQDIIDAHEKWTIFTSLDTMRADGHGAKMQNLKVDMNARLTGAKKEWVIATLDALWGAWKSWNDRGWKTLQNKMLQGLRDMQTQLKQPPDVVEKEITKIVTEYVLAPTTVLPEVVPVKKGWLGIPTWGWVVIGVLPLGWIGYIAYKKMRK